jgi:uncharacterized protein involved in type VI secretion and phage assembly
MTARPSFFGKFRGVVSDTQDPLMLARIKARVPDVFGDNESGWALPCAPFGGTAFGLFALPGVGAGVWIEFEQGDPDRPIWTGSWWGTPAEVPSVLKPIAAKKVLLKTEGGHSILLDDTPGSGGIVLETSAGQKVSITANGIEINNGQGAQVKLSGAQVSINNGGLEVT